MNNFKKIPSVDEILARDRIKELLNEYNRDFILDGVRTAINAVRDILRTTEGQIDQDTINDYICASLESIITAGMKGTLQKVINCTGVVLHTNLARAPLGERALGHLNKMAVNYNNLEMDLETGTRGSRYRHVEKLLAHLTGAEDALVVNNNAAAVLLGLSVLAHGKEVIVSRGQLIEIGGAFRIPEVMKLSGAKLVEVGTTNKTRINDYSTAINEETGLLFSAHTSNYKIIGFTEEVQLGELVKLSRQKGIPAMQDLGSGILLKLDDWGLSEEPTVQECVAAGADIVTFSGDKLLGGPQSGLIVGKKQYIEKMKKSQLLRAIRVGKLTIAALEGTLIEYLAGDPLRKIPVINMLTVSSEELKAKAQNLHEMITEKMAGLDKVGGLSVITTEDIVGGGAYPTYRLPGYGVEIQFVGVKLEAVARSLRLMDPALITRKRDNKMIISVRTLLLGDEKLICEMLAKALVKGENND